MSETRDPREERLGYYDPVCTLHGKRWSQHEGGRCLYCCVCFNPLTPEECYVDADGQKWDLCRACGEREAERSGT